VRFDAFRDREETLQVSSRYVPAVEIATTFADIGDFDPVIDFVFEALGSGGEPRTRTNIADPPMSNSHAAALAKQFRSEKWQLRSEGCSVRIERTTTYLPDGPTWQIRVQGFSPGKPTVTVAARAGLATIDVVGSVEECERIFEAFRRTFEHR
jgi:hypothetical protein